MDIQEAKKVINKRTERLLEEFKIEKEVEPQDEPEIAYLMQEIRANKTILSELDKKDKIINDAKQWIENTMNDRRIVGCNLGDLQMLLDILESED